MNSAPAMLSVYERGLLLERYLVKGGELAAQSRQYRVSVDTLNDGGSHELFQLNLFYKCLRLLICFFHIHVCFFVFVIVHVNYFTITFTVLSPLLMMFTPFCRRCWRAPAAL